MTPSQRLKVVATTLACSALLLAGISASTPRGRTHDRGEDESDSRIQRGFDIAAQIPAPFHLNLEGKNRALVGLGSYIVNTHDCNGCHSAGPPTEFVVPHGNPYFLSPPFSVTKEINPKTYLAGGRDFGPFGPVGGPVPQLQHLYTRNLTPDKTGLPEGGHTFEEFVQIMRKGTDFDHVHPNCGAPGAPGSHNCMPPPFNGDVIQVMPWPIFQDITDHDLRAIYEYLKAIPCNPGPGIAGADYLQNTCE